VPDGEPRDVGEQAGPVEHSVTVLRARLLSTAVTSPEPEPFTQRAVHAVQRLVGEGIRTGWEWAGRWGSIGPHDARGRRFGSFGEGSIICFPPNTIFNERYIHLGDHTMLGPQITLSAGMVPGQECLADAVVRIGSRCLIGKGSGIVGHLSIEIGDDVWTGHHVYITDQNHGYRDVELAISRQTMPERPVRIGDGSWLGHGTVVLPGADIGRHVVVGANSVVTGVIPDFSVAVGSPARVVRRFEGGAWHTVAPPAG
jgi:acetyltransferase-like isoleucine patch superfamily enzyme